MCRRRTPACRFRRRIRCIAPCEASNLTIRTAIPWRPASVSVRPICETWGTTYISPPALPHFKYEAACRHQNFFIAIDQDRPVHWPLPGEGLAIAPKEYPVLGAKPVC
jgi:hypothetical protein